MDSEYRRAVGDAAAVLSELQGLDIELSQGMGYLGKNLNCRRQCVRQNKVARFLINGALEVYGHGGLFGMSGRRAPDASSHSSAMDVNFAFCKNL